MPKRLSSHVSMGLKGGEGEEREVPNTITRAALYGNGSVKLKESSSGSTLGSPSIAIAESNAALNEIANGRGPKNDWSEECARW